MAHRTRRAHPRLVGILLAVVSALPAFGETATPIGELVTQLDTDALRDREAATGALGERVDELAGAIGTDIDPSSLSAEQLARINELLHQRFLLSPRAGLGVGFAQPPANELTPGVTIGSVVPGFPAATLLRPGDIVLSAEGTSYVDLNRSEAYTSFRFAILSLEPGESLHVEILRGAERLELAIPTGSFTDLNQAAPPDSRLLEGAWRLRAERLGLSPGAITRLDAAQRNGWIASYKPRRDVPGMLPGGRPKNIEDAERSVPSLAKVNTNAKSVTKQQLAAAAQLRELETRITNTRSRIRTTREEARVLDPAGAAFQQKQGDILRYERELQFIERQRKEIINRIGALSGAGR